MTKDEALLMCLEYIETDAHERKYVRHAIKAALKAKDEPVAYIYEFWADRGHKGLSFEKERSADNTPLYTTPPPVAEPHKRTWVGLTDDEIVLIVAECAASHQHTDIHFARAIEAKLKEKNT